MCVSTGFESLLTEFNLLIPFYRWQFFYDKFKIQIWIIYWFVVEMIAFLMLSKWIVRKYFCNFGNALNFGVSLSLFFLCCYATLSWHSTKCCLCCPFFTTMSTSTRFFWGPIIFMSFIQCHAVHIRWAIRKEKVWFIFSFALSRFVQFVIILLHGTFY